MKRLMFYSSLLAACLMVSPNLFGQAGGGGGGGGAGGGGASGGTGGGAGGAAGGAGATGGVGGAGATGGVGGAGATGGVGGAGAAGNPGLSNNPTTGTNAGSAAALQNQPGRTGVNNQTSSAMQGRGFNAQGTGSAAGTGTGAGIGTGAGSATTGMGIGSSGTGLNQTPWFSGSNVRQSLGLNDQQFNQLNQAYGNNYSQYQAGMQSLGSDMSPAQRTQAINELRGRFDTGFNQATQDILSDRQTQNRYNQLYWQYQGYDAFRNPQIRQTLNLTDAQMQRFNSLGETYNQQLSGLQQQYATNPNSISPQFGQLQGEMNNQINSVLTPDQRIAWRSMMGDPYQFGADAYFGSNTGVQGRLGSTPGQQPAGVNTSTGGNGRVQTGNTPGRTGTLGTNDDAAPLGAGATSTPGSTTGTGGTSTGTIESGTSTEALGSGIGGGTGASAGAGDQDTGSLTTGGTLP